MKLFSYFWSEITNRAPLTQSLRIICNAWKSSLWACLNISMPLPNETWSMQVKQSLPKSNIKIKCAFTVSLWVICSLERSFDSKLNSRQFRFTVAMFIKQGAVSKRPIAANYGMKYYSTIVLLPTDELEDHFVLS